MRAALHAKFAWLLEATELRTRIGANEITQLSNDACAADAADSIYQEVARFLQTKSASQTTDEYLARFDLLRRMAESEMQIRGDPPDMRAAFLRL